MRRFARPSSKMGDSDTLGKQFRQTYKPHTEWSLLGLVFSFIGIGLFDMYSIENSHSLRVAEIPLFVDKSIAAAMGIMIAQFTFPPSVQAAIPETGSGFTEFTTTSSLCALAIMTRTCAFQGGMR
ncbi:hypothetical protein [Ammoniphilus sp. 3BR4]|uniref:hypothetical protein n=1 Tax=Ammoniphilus sp. 3BR4 TaxID=3158265 RepID=UPI003465E2AB